MSKWIGKMVTMGVIIGGGMGLFTACPSENPTAPEAELSVPKNINASDGTSASAIDITWDSVDGAASYYVYQADAPDGDYTQIGHVSSKNYSATSVLPLTSYYYKVCAYEDDLGKSDLSVSDEGFRQLGIPTNLSATDGTDIPIVLTWDGVSGAEGYHVYVSNSDSGPYSTVDGTTGTSYSYGVGDINTYWFKLRAYCAGGVSEFSDYDDGQSNGMF